MAILASAIAFVTSRFLMFSFCFCMVRRLGRRFALPPCFTRIYGVIAHGRPQSSNHSFYFALRDIPRAFQRFIPIAATIDPSDLQGFESMGPAPDRGPKSGG